MRKGDSGMRDSARKGVYAVLTATPAMAPSARHKCSSGWTLAARNAHRVARAPSNLMQTPLHPLPNATGQVCLAASRQHRSSTSRPG